MRGRKDGVGSEKSIFAVRLDGPAIGVTDALGSRAFEKDGRDLAFVCEGSLTLRPEVVL